MHHIQLVCIVVAVSVATIVAYNFKGPVDGFEESVILTRRAQCNGVDSTQTCSGRQNCTTDMDCPASNPFLKCCSMAQNWSCCYDISTAPVTTQCASACGASPILCNSTVSCSGLECCRDYASSNQCCQPTISTCSAAYNSYCIASSRSCSKDSDCASVSTNPKCCIRGDSSRCCL